MSYATATSRNIGWVTEAEQARLNRATVAIAGMGGVGGAYAMTMARLGVGSFRLADFDTFEQGNLNRQAGALHSTLGHAKLDVIAGTVRDINPAASVTTFPAAVSEENVHDFLQTSDVYLDGLDFFTLEARKTIFSACRRLSIPGVTVAPLGMSAALVNFLPDGMSFLDYFQISQVADDEAYLRFFAGLAPSALQRGSLVDPSSIDLSKQKGPSTIMGCQLCAGIAGTEALKLILNRGRILSAPRAMQFDAYTNRSTITWIPGGNRNPLQRLRLRQLRRQMLVAEMSS